MKGLWALLLIAVGCSGYEPKPLEEHRMLEELRGIKIEFPAEGLDAEQAVAIALVWNPDLRALRREREIAEAQVVSAEAWENPELRLNLSNLLVSSNPALALGSALRIFPGVPGESSARVSRAEARRDEAMARIEDGEARLAAEVRIAHGQVRHLEETVEIVEASLGLKDKLVGLIEERMRGFVSTRHDAASVALERSLVERERNVVRSEREAAWGEWNALLGLSPETRTRLKGVREAKGVEASSAEALEEESLARRADLRVLKHQYEQAEQTLRLEHLKRVPWPRFLQPEAGDVTDVGADGLGAGMGMELPVFHQNGGGIAGAEAERERARERYQAKLHAVRGEIHRARSEVEEKGRQVKLYRESLEGTVRSLDEDMRVCLEAGQIDEVAWVKCQDQALRLRLGALQAAFEYQTAVVRLDLARGAIFQ